MADPKAFFSPVPNRAMRDEGLSGVDLRVMIAVATFDRMSLKKGNGPGCYASFSTLASKVGCHLKSVSRSIATLEQRGYIVRAPHPLNRRLYVLRIVYTPEDEGLIASAIGNEPVTCSDDPRSTMGNEFVPMGNEIVPLGNNDFEKPEQSQSDARVSILQHNRKHSQGTRAREEDEERLESDLQASVAASARLEFEKFEIKLKADPDSFSTDVLEAYVLWFGQRPRHAPNHPDIAEAATRLISEIQSVIEARSEAA